MRREAAVGQRDWREKTSVAIPALGGNISPRVGSKGLPAILENLHVAEVPRREAHCLISGSRERRLGSLAEFRL